MPTDITAADVEQMARELESLEILPLSRSEQQQCAARLAPRLTPPLKPSSPRGEKFMLCQRPDRWRITTAVVCAAAAAVAIALVAPAIVPRKKSSEPMDRSLTSGHPQLPSSAQDPEDRPNVSRPDAPAITLLNVQERAVPSTGPQFHVVQAGDTLIDIARQHYGNTRRWHDIMNANPGVEPRRLKIGSRLRLPSTL